MTYYYSCAICKIINDVVERCGFISEAFSRLDFILLEIVNMAIMH